MGAIRSRGSLSLLPLLELALVLVRLDHVASGIVNASLRFFGHASRAPTHHETIQQEYESMDAQGRQRETAMLVGRAQRVLGESRKLLEEREMQLKQQEQFREQRATIADEMVRDTATLLAMPV